MTNGNGFAGKIGGPSSHRPARHMIGLLKQIANNTRQLATPGIRVISVANKKCPGGPEDELKKGLAKKVLGVVGAAAALAIGTVVATKKFVDEVVNVNRELGQVNGPIAASFQRLDVNDFLNRIQRAHGTQESTIALNNTVVEFRKAMLPAETALTNITNFFAIILLKTVTPALNGVQKALEELSEILGKEADVKKGNPVKQDDLIRDLLNGMRRGGASIERSRPLPPMWKATDSRAQRSRDQLIQRPGQRPGRTQQAESGNVPIECPKAAPRSPTTASRCLTCKPAHSPKTHLRRDGHGSAVSPDRDPRRRLFREHAAAMPTGIR